MSDHVITMPSSDGDHRWRFSRCESGMILCSYSLTRPREENGVVWQQCLESVAGSLEPATMAPRPGRWALKARHLRLELLPDGALEQVRDRLEVSS